MLVLVFPEVFAIDLEQYQLSLHLFILFGCFFLVF